MAHGFNSLESLQHVDENFNFQDDPAKREEIADEHPMSSKKVEEILRDINLVPMTGEWSNKDFLRFWKLYCEAFPITDERRTLDAQLQVIKNPKYKVTFMEDHGELVGFLATWDLETTDGHKWLFIEHTAVDRDLRNKGLGSVVGGKVLMEAVKEAGALKKTVVGEIEPPTGDPKNTADRRASLYQRMGLKLNSDFKYIQPSYSAGQSPLPMVLVTFGEPVRDQKQFEDLRKVIHSTVYGKKEPVTELPAEKEVS